MPYIVQEQRDTLKPSLDGVQAAIATLDMEGANVDGVVNYTISTIVSRSFNPTGGRWSYFMIARAMGAFICAALEFYRRVAGPKEDIAIAENGDIEPYSRVQ